MEIIIEQNHENNLFEEVAFYKGMLGEFSYNPREFCITFANIKDKQTDVLRYIGNGNEIHLPQGVMAVPYLLKEGYDEFDCITIVNHSNRLIDIDYMLYKTKIRSVTLEGFSSSVYIQTAESAFEGSYLESIDMNAMNLSRCRNMIKMFADTRLSQVNLSGIYLKNDLDASYIFENCALLKEVEWFNNGADSRLELTMNASFRNCSRLRDWRIYDADDFTVNEYTGEIRSIIPEESPLYANTNSFLQGFVPEFNDKMGVRLNEAFDIKVLNEYSMLLMNSTAKALLNNIKFIFRLFQELKMDAYGEEGEIKQIHFVNSIGKAIGKRQEREDVEKVILVQPRQSIEEDVIVYALYYESTVKGYRVKYHNKYYDISTTEYVELGLTDILPSKKLKLNVKNDEYYVSQTSGEAIEIYGYNELAQELR